MPSRSSSRCTRATPASRSGARSRCASRDRRAEVAAAVRVARRHGRPFVARGSGTGLAGGATPLDDPVVIVTTQMNRVLEVDAEARVAWVEPGVLNLDLSRAVAPSRPALRARPVVAAGVHDRRQRRHQRGRAALPGRRRHVGAHPGRRRRPRRRHRDPARRARPRHARLRPAGLLRRFRGHDGDRDPHRGAPHARSAVRRHDAVRVRLGRGRGRDRQRRDRGGRAARRARDDGRAHHPGGRGLRRRGLPARRAGRAARRGRRSRRAASPSRSTRSPRSRAPTARRSCGSPPTTPSARCLWKGRKSAFGAIARIAPDYYLHDAVVPRTKLVEVLRRVYEIADAHDLIVMNVFHAGDGNLHPLLVFDRREPGIWERVYAAGTEILDACLDAGGVLTGEHGVGHREARPHAAHVLGRRPRRAGAPARRVRSRRRREPAEGACRAAAGAASCNACPRERGYEHVAGRSSPRSAARTHWEVGGPPPAGAVEVRAPRRRDRVRARRHDDHGRRGHQLRRARRGARRTGPGVRARSARRVPRRSAASSRAACRGCAGCATDRSATTCSRCASRPATAGS